jgi:hypothetical protein
MSDAEYLKDLAFRVENLGDLTNKANAILAQKIKNHSAPVRLWKGPKYTHEGRVVLIKEIGRTDDESN